MAGYRSVAEAASGGRKATAFGEYSGLRFGPDGTVIEKPIITPGRVLRLGRKMAQQDEQDEQAEQDAAPAREQQAFVQPAIIRGTFQLHLATDILAVLISTVPLLVVAAWCYRTKPWKR